MPWCLEPFAEGRRQGLSDGLPWLANNKHRLFLHRYGRISILYFFRRVSDLALSCRPALQRHWGCMFSKRWAEKVSRVRRYWLSTTKGGAKMGWFAGCDRNCLLWFLCLFVWAWVRGPALSDWLASGLIHWTVKCNIAINRTPPAYSGRWTFLGGHLLNIFIGLQLHK